MKSIIFGIGGQDSLFLTRLLKEKGYEVYGVVDCNRSRNSKFFNLVTLDHLIECDFRSEDALAEALKLPGVSSIFNLIGFSSVHLSFKQEVECFESNFYLFHRILTVAKKLQIESHIFQCSSSEMYAGLTGTSSISEETPVNPISPYGISKVASHFLSRLYREVYGLNISTGILFNHESEYRTLNFFTKRAAVGLVDFYFGKIDKVPIQSLDFNRDWSYASDFAKAFEAISLQKDSDDYVISSGILHSGRDFFEVGLKCLGLNMEVEEVVSFDNESIRPIDHRGFLGDNSKIMKTLSWRPEVDFEQMVEKLISFELKKRK